MLKNTIDCREQQLEKLKSFTDAVNKEIADIVDTLGWTVESVTNAKEYLTCPYNPSHRLTEESLNDHLVSCQWKAEGYGKSDTPFPESTLPADSPFSIKFDMNLQAEVLSKAKEQNLAQPIGMAGRLIPHTSDRLLTDFTTDERRALYNYAVANTAKLDLGQDIADINNLKPQEKDTTRELSFLELLAQERNLKRRRAKHRGVHTNKKSHTEILREVINQQMEIYTDCVSEQTPTSSEHNAMDVPSGKRNDSDYEMTQDRMEHLYKAFHASPRRNYDDSNFREKDDHHRSKRYDVKREHSEKKGYQSRDRDRRERHSDESTSLKCNHSKHRKSSKFLCDRKSQRKDKYRGKDKHKEKHNEKKHKMRDREKSSERHTKHSKHRRKE